MLNCLNDYFFCVKSFFLFCPLLCFFPCASFLLGKSVIFSQNVSMYTNFL